MKLLRSLFVFVLFVALLAFATQRGFASSGAPGAIIAALAVVAVASCFRAPRAGGVVADATLTVDEILMDVIESFKKQFPGLSTMGMDFRAQTLKLDKTYTAHIPSLPAVATYSTSTGYKNGAQTARSLFTDVDIKVSNHKHVPLLFKHLDSIKDDKQKYEKAIADAGFVLAKSVIDDGLGKVTTRNFSQESVYAVADSDLDAIDNINADMNLVGALPNGRVMIVNTPVATIIGADSRVASNFLYGQRTGGQSYRRFTNIGGFAEVMEYPDLPSNNVTALTGVTGANAGDLMTKVAHGLKTGDPVTFVSGTSFTGLTAGTKYWAIRASADTFQVASTYANAIAGTAVALGADGTSGVFQLTENLTGFAFDMRALAFLGGVPDGFQSELAAQLGIKEVMSMRFVTHEGITMAGVGWQEAGTGDLYWSPVLVWGWRAGKEDPTVGDGAANAAGTLCDYAGHRLVSA